MKRFFQSEAGAAVLWVASALVMGAAISPWLYRAGMNLAQSAATTELSGALEWLGAACGRADFSRFYSRALVASAVVSLPLLFRRIQVVRAANGGNSESCVRVSWQSALAQIGVGCLIAGGILWATGMLLEHFGAFAAKPNPMAFGKLLGRIIVPAVVVPLLEESLIRGLLLGLWLKFAKPLHACIGTSLFFAFIHFLKLPDGEFIANPASPLAGFELLGKILFHFTDPRFFVTDFATLFVIGMILAGARLRTGALWFSIGLHGGWILAFKGYNLLHVPIMDHPIQPWGVGISLRSGLFPLLALGVTAVVCHFALRWFDAKRTPG